MDLAYLVDLIEQLQRELTRDQKDSDWGFASKFHELSVGTLQGAQNIAFLLVFL